jgi:hypothetical protein
MGVTESFCEWVVVLSDDDESSSVNHWMILECSSDRLVPGLDLGDFYPWYSRMLGQHLLGQKILVSKIDLTSAFGTGPTFLYWKMSLRPLMFWKGVFAIMAS